MLGAQLKFKNHLFSRSNAQKATLNKLCHFLDKNKKNTQQMIDFSQFEVKDSIEQPKDACYLRKFHQISSGEQCPTAFSLSSIHEPNIQEIRDHLDSFDLSENLLDRLENIEKDLQHPEKGMNFRESEEQENQRRKFERRMKNQTKNIPKNFGKGIISFIQKSEAKLRKLLKQHGMNFADFLAFLQQEKKRINTIADLRRLWTNQTYGRPMRIISNLFFRKHCLVYIFNSRISNYASHVKYRQTLWSALRNPEQFNHIKEY